MILATKIVSLSSRQVRNGQRALRSACNRSMPQKRLQSSIGCESLQEAPMNNCDVLHLEEEDRLLNDLAYSLSMACDGKVFPLGHRPNRRQQRQLWLSKTQPLLGEVWLKKESYRPASFEEEEIA